MKIMAPTGTAIKTPAAIGIAITPAIPKGKPESDLNENALM